MKKIKKITAALLVLTIIGGLTGCSKAQAGAVQNSNWPSSIVVVQFPNENNPNAGTRHEAFSKALSEYLGGIEIKEIEGTEYTVGIEAMANGKIDVMGVSPMSYYQAKNRAGAELLVSTPLASEYRTVFITRADNNAINTMEDLKGHNFAFVEQASSSGYMYPKAKLVNDFDLDPALVENNGYFFSSVAFSGAHDASVTGVVMGDYEAAAVAGMIIDQMADAGAVNKEELKIIGQTDLIPNPAYVVRGALPDDLKAKIKEFFLQYSDVEYFKDVHNDENIRFVDITEDDYKIIYDTLSALKMEE